MSGADSKSYGATTHQNSFYFIEKCYNYHIYCVKFWLNYVLIANREQISDIFQTQKLDSGVGWKRKLWTQNL